MFEIEIKAHVQDRDAVQKKLSQFAFYECTKQKQDTYYTNGSVSVRLRKEQTDCDTSIIEKYLQNAPTSNHKSSKTILTYKRQDFLSHDKTAPEVNQEHECHVSDAVPIEVFLLDAGFRVLLSKQKKIRMLEIPHRRRQRFDRIVFCSSTWRFFGNRNFVRNK